MEAPADRAGPGPRDAPREPGGRHGGGGGGRLQERVWAEGRRLPARGPPGRPGPGMGPSRAWDTYSRSSPSHPIWPPGHHHTPCSHPSCQKALSELQISQVLVPTPPGGTYACSHGALPTLSPSSPSTVSVGRRLHICSHCPLSRDAWCPQQREHSPQEASGSRPAWELTWGGARRCICPKQDE